MILLYIGNDGFNGILELLNKQPNVILLDIMMPDMDGYRVLETICEQSSIKIPVIVCSNLSQESDIQKAYELWAVEYIKKSDVDADEIVERVKARM